MDPGGSGADCVVPGVLVAPGIRSVRGTRKGPAILLALAISLAVLLASTGCDGGANPGGYSRYSYEFYGTFDTVIQFLGYAQSAEAFETYGQQGEARFQELHRLFNRYESYEGVNNIKTINDNAGIAPVAVAPEILDLLEMSREWSGKVGGVVDVTLGPVLEVWHRYREEGLADPAAARVPTRDELEEALSLTGLSDLVIDREAGTVFLKRKGMSLDVGAMAKGVACAIVARELREAGLDSVIVSSGSSVAVVGQPRDGIRTSFGIGIQNPDGNVNDEDEASLDIIFVHDKSIGTSGDYQRYYTVEGVRYHHLVDPATLFPADHVRAVTVLYPDAGIGDLLSTALFLLPLAEGQALCRSIPGLEAVWVLKDGTLLATDGMKIRMKQLGGATSQADYDAEASPTP